MKCLNLALVISVALLMSIMLVSAEKTNETYICEYSYYFIIGHLQTGNILSYQDADLQSLRNSLISERNIDVGNYTNLNPYMENYTEICGTETPDLVLPPIIFDVKIINLPHEGEEFYCDSYINKTFLGFYNLDWSFPFFTIHKGEINCGATQFFKWFFNYEKTGKYDYSLTGIKLWWIFLILIVSLIVIYYKINRKINDVIAKESLRG